MRGKVGGGQGEEAVAESRPGRRQFKGQQAAEAVTLGSGVPQSWLCDLGQVMYHL